MLFSFIADIHSLTTHPIPEDLHSNVHQVLAEYLAMGLDPDKCTLFVQSDVPQISELYTYMNMNAYLGELERSASFKDKVKTQRSNVNAGLSDLSRFNGSRYPHPQSGLMYRWVKTKNSI